MPQVEEARDVVDQQVKLSSIAVQNAITEVVEEMKTANRITLATTLDQAVMALEFNKVKLTLGTDVERNMLERDRNEVATLLRSKTGYNTLFIEILVDQSLVPQRDDKPYTMEDKLKVLTEKNPAMKRLQEIFRTRIIQ